MFNVFLIRQRLGRDVTDETSSAQSATVSRLVCLVLVCMNVCCGWWGIGVEMYHNWNLLTRLETSILLTKQKI